MSEYLLIVPETRRKWRKTRRHEPSSSLSCIHGSNGKEQQIKSSGTQTETHRVLQVANPRPKMGFVCILLGLFS